MAEVQNKDSGGQQVYKATAHDPATGERSTVTVSAGTPQGITPGNPREPEVAHLATLKDSNPEKFNDEVALKAALENRARDAAEDAPDPRFTPYTEELTRDGNLSDESIKKAAAEFKVPEKVVRSYLAAQQSQQSQGAAPQGQSPESQRMDAAHVSAVYEGAGGEKEWAAYRDWAKTNAPGDLELISKALEDGAPSVTRLVTEVSVRKAAAARKVAAEAQRSDDARNEAGFSSTSEQSAAIRDPRYKRDRAYRESVERRMQKSSL